MKIITLIILVTLMLQINVYSADRGRSKINFPLLVEGTLEVNGHVTVEGGTSEEYTLPVTKGVKNKVVKSNGDGTTYWGDDTGTGGGGTSSGTNEIQISGNGDGSFVSIPEFKRISTDSDTKEVIVAPVITPDAISVIQTEDIYGLIDALNSTTNMGTGEIIIFNDSSETTLTDKFKCWMKGENKIYKFSMSFVEDYPIGPINFLQYIFNTTYEEDYSYIGDTYEVTANHVSNVSPHGIGGPCDLIIYVDTAEAKDVTSYTISGFDVDFGTNDTGNTKFLFQDSSGTKYSLLNYQKTIDATQSSSSDFLDWENKAPGASITANSYDVDSTGDYNRIWYEIESGYYSDCTFEVTFENTTTDRIVPFFSDTSEYSTNNKFGFFMYINGGNVDIDYLYETSRANITTINVSQKYYFRILLYNVNAETKKLDCKLWVESTNPNGSWGSSDETFTNKSYSDNNGKCVFTLYDDNLTTTSPLVENLSVRQWKKDASNGKWVDISGKSSPNNYALTESEANGKLSNYKSDTSKNSLRTVTYCYDTGTSEIEVEKINVQ